MIYRFEAYMEFEGVEYSLVMEHDKDISKEEFRDIVHSYLKELNSDKKGFIKYEGIKEHLEELGFRQCETAGYLLNVLAERETLFSDD